MYLDYRRNANHIFLFFLFFCFIQIVYDIIPYIRQLFQCGPHKTENFTDIMRAAIGDQIFIRARRGGEKVGRSRKVSIFENVAFTPHLMHNLTICYRLFTSLSKKTGVFKQKHLELAKLRASHCINVKNQALKQIKEAAILDEQRRERLEEIKKHQQRIENEKNVKQLDEIIRLTKEEEDIQKYRDELQQKVIQDIDKLAQSEPKRGAKSSAESKKGGGAKNIENSPNATKNKSSLTSNQSSKLHVATRSSQEASEKRSSKRINSDQKVSRIHSKEELANKKAKLDVDDSKHFDDKSPDNMDDEPLKLADK